MSVYFLKNILASAAQEVERRDDEEKNRVEENACMDYHDEICEAVENDEGHKSLELYAHSMSFA